MPQINEQKPLADKIREAADILMQIAEDTSYFEISQMNKSSQLTLPYEDVYRQKLEHGLDMYTEKSFYCVQELIALLNA